jgi:hypothetical protein
MFALCLTVGIARQAAEYEHFRGSRGGRRAPKPGILAHLSGSPEPLSKVVVIQDRTIQVCLIDKPAQQTTPLPHITGRMKPLSEFVECKSRFRCVAHHRGRDPVALVIGSAASDRQQMIDRGAQFPKSKMADIEPPISMKGELFGKPLRDQSQRRRADQSEARIAVYEPIAGDHRKHLAHRVTPPDIRQWNEWIPLAEDRGRIVRLVGSECGANIGHTAALSFIRLTSWPMPASNASTRARRMLALGCAGSLTLRL